MAYLDDIENANEFEKVRANLQRLLENSDETYSEFMDLFIKLLDFKYVSSKNWMGIPIVKLPEDIVVIQEFYFDFRPTAVIEVGVARGGSVALAISLQKLMDLKPNVLGIDIKIFEHTHKALAGYIDKDFLKLVETDSISGIAKKEIETFVKNHEKVFVILDGNHSHNHVKMELNLLNLTLPVGSVVLIADGIIRHLPERDDRPWSGEDNPYTATMEFLAENPNWRKLEKYSRRSIFSEFRDGWITKIE
jgi:cephalosporin hydroxylase